MKRTLFALFLALFTFAPLGLVTATSGCKATPQTVAYRTVASVQAAVEASLAAWGDYVVFTEKKIAALPPDQQQSATDSLNSRRGLVRVAIARYQKAAEVARAGVAAALSADKVPATTAMIDAANQLTSTAVSLSK